MDIKEGYKKLRSKIEWHFSAFKRLPWWHGIVMLFCIVLSITVFLILKSKSFKTIDTNSTLTNLLTVNGVFSAILITYLFSRITWLKERKLEVYKDAISISQKITEYRRIINKLTTYYNVWKSDKSTKSLISHGRFKTIDFYDYRLSSISNYKPHNYQLIQELRSHSDFEEGISTLYLAMVSLVKNRNNPDYEWQEELYKDFEINGIYNIKAVEKWLECGIFGTIWFWLDKDYHFINYSALRTDKEYILSAISRINKKYEGQDLSNKLLKEITDDFTSHYLNELYLSLKELKNGVADLNLIIIILITISLIFGVLTPFGLLLIQTKTYWFSLSVGIVASVNAGLISYFIFRFPTLINKELKWI
jgi:hypothetical protein